MTTFRIFIRFIKSEIEKKEIDFILKFNRYAKINDVNTLI